MEAHLLLRAGAPRTLSGQTSASLLATARPASLRVVATAPGGAGNLLCQQQRRTKLTSNRTKRALNIPPHPSFLETSQEQDSVVFNPPSSQASVYHTPFKFLPKSDPRRRANLASLFSASRSSSSDASSSLPPSNTASSRAGDAAAPTTPQSQTQPQLPPAVPKMPQGTLNDFYNVTKADVDEMRRLRNEDPERWSVVALAKKFKTTKMLVMIAAGSKTITPHRRKMAEELEKVKERWGAAKWHAYEEREKRRELLYKGEL